MKLVLVLLLIVAGCGDDLDLPSCAELDSEHGCFRVSCADQRPSDTAVCTCWFDTADGNFGRQACTIGPPPPCAELGCESLVCGELTPEGDTDPTACVCWLPNGRPEQCVGE